MELYLFIFNLGVEMINILRQRLLAHDVNNEKTSNGLRLLYYSYLIYALVVLDALILFLLDRTFMDNLNSATAMYSLTSIKTIFDKFIAGSGMKLTEIGLDKVSQRKYT